MNKYTIELEAVGTRYVGRILKNSRVLLSTDNFRKQDDARCSANYMLTQIEKSNGHWDSDHTEATYHYLHA